MRKRNPLKLNIFGYLDFRKYLEDVFAAHKAANPKFSYRAFSQKAGLSSPNFLQLVLAGKRKPTTSNIFALGKALSLTRQETDFLTHLISFNEAKTHEEKNSHYQRMLRIGPYSGVNPIHKDQYEYFSQWYNPVVRELLTHKKFTGDLAWIARKINPAISEAQTEKSVETLKKLGLIAYDEDAEKWLPAQTVISTQAQVASVAAAQYHKAMIQFGMDALDRTESGQRDIRSVTLGVSLDGFQEIKSRMENFWKEILAFAVTQNEVEAVYQVNLQLFPLTRPEENEAENATPIPD